MGQETKRRPLFSKPKEGENLPKGEPISLMPQYEDFPYPVDEFLKGFMEGSLGDYPKTLPGVAGGVVGEFGIPKPLAAVTLLPPSMLKQLGQDLISRAKTAPGLEEILRKVQQLYPRVFGHLDNLQLGKIPSPGPDNVTYGMHIPRDHYQPYSVLQDALIEEDELRNAGQLANAATNAGIKNERLGTLRLNTVDRVTPERLTTTIGHELTHQAQRLGDRFFPHNYDTQIRTSGYFNAPYEESARRGGAKVNELVKLMETGMSPEAAKKAYRQKIGKPAAQLRKAETSVQKHAFGPNRAAPSMEGDIDSYIDEMMSSLPNPDPNMSVAPTDERTARLFERFNQSIDKGTAAPITSTRRRLSRAETEMLYKEMVDQGLAGTPRSLPDVYKGADTATRRELAGQVNSPSKAFTPEAARPAPTKINVRIGDPTRADKVLDTLAELKVRVTPQQAQLIRQAAIETPDDVKFFSTLRRTFSGHYATSGAGGLPFKSESFMQAYRKRAPVEAAAPTRRREPISPEEEIRRIQEHKRTKRQ